MAGATGAAAVTLLAGPDSGAVATGALAAAARFVTGAATVLRGVAPGATRAVVAGALLAAARGVAVVEVAVGALAVVGASGETVWTTGRETVGVALGAVVVAGAPIGPADCTGDCRTGPGLAGAADGIVVGVIGAGMVTGTITCASAVVEAKARTAAIAVEAERARVRFVCIVPKKRSAGN